MWKTRNETRNSGSQPVSCGQPGQREPTARRTWPPPHRTDRCGYLALAMKANRGDRLGTCRNPPGLLATTDREAAWALCRGRDQSNPRRFASTLTITALPCLQVPVGSKHAAAQAQKCWGWLRFATRCRLIRAPTARHLAWTCHDRPGQPGVNALSILQKAERPHIRLIIQGLCNGDQHPAPEDLHRPGRPVLLSGSSRCVLIRKGGANGTRLFYLRRAVSGKSWRTKRKRTLPRRNQYRRRRDLLRIDPRNRTVHR